MVIRLQICENFQFGWSWPLIGWPQDGHRWSYWKKDIRYEFPDPNNLCFDILEAYFSVLFPYLFAGGHDHSLWPLTTCQSSHKTFGDTFLSKDIQDHHIYVLFSQFQPVSVNLSGWTFIKICCVVMTIKVAINGTHDHFPIPEHLEI